MIFLLMLISLVLTSCNSRKDVQHISQKKMTDYVKNTIHEDISLVSVESDEYDNVITYIFKLDDRNMTFKVTSVIYALSIDGARFGNYNKEIYIYYEKGIVESEYYIAERLRIGNELNIEEKDRDFAYSTINVNNYKDIDKLAQYAIELDKLYSFNERKPNRVIHSDLGALSFSSPGTSIEGPKFSTNKKERLNYKDVYNEIVNSYLAQLVKFDLYDNTIPKDEWDQYNK